MAADTDRRITRQDPITVVVDIGDGKELSLTAVPLPWRKRNDLADLILNSSNQAFNNLVAIASGDADVPTTMNTSFYDSQMDYAGILVFCYPDVKQDDLDQLSFDQIIEVIDAALHLNGLDRLGYLVDPDRKKDQVTGESASPTEEPTDAGPKTD